LNSKSILKRKRKRRFNILAKILKEALPRETESCFKFYLNYSTKIIIMEYFCNGNISKEANISYGNNIIPLGFILFKETKGFNEVTLLIANLKAKRAFGLKGIGTFLINKVKELKKKIYLYPDPGVFNFYLNRGFKNLISTRKKKLAKILCVPEIVSTSNDCDFVDKDIDKGEEFVIFENGKKHVPNLYVWNN
jgi:hypothetical protein